VAEVHHFTSHSYEWVLEGEIKACFDEIDHIRCRSAVVGPGTCWALIWACTVH